MTPNNSARRGRGWLAPFVHLSNNWISLIGVVLVTTATVFWLFLLPITMGGDTKNPYLGILAFLTLPVLLYCRRWRAAAGYSAAAALAVLVSLPLVGVDEYRRYWSVQQAVARWTTSNDALQLDVPGVHGLFMQHWPHSGAADTAANLCIAALCIALAVYWRGRWRPGTPGFVAGWALTVLVTLLSAPFAHSYDQVLLVIPMVVCYVYWQRSWWSVPMLTALYVAPGLVLLYRQHFAVPAMLAAGVMLWVTVRRMQAASASDAPVDQSTQLF